MSLLTNVSTGKIAKPPLITIYGPPGIGKSSFAASAPKPLVIDVEDSTGNLDVARLGSEHFKTHRDVANVIASLMKDEHEYKTLIVDSADWLEAIIFNDVATGAGKKIVSDIGYGAGYTESASIMRYLLDGLKKLRDAKNMAVIMVAHDQIKRFDDPVNESYDRHELKLHRQNADVLMEWSEVLLFATQEVFIENKEKRFNRTVNKGRGGDRIMYTVEQPAFRAKNRFNLPEQLPLSWDAFVTAMKGSN